MSIMNARAINISPLKHVMCANQTEMHLPVVNMVNVITELKQDKQHHGV